MHLRSLIQGSPAPAKLDSRIQPSSRRPPVFDSRTLATVATSATVAPFSDRAAETVATVATVATLPEPESWADLLRTLPAVEGASWDVAAAVLDSLMSAGVIDKALGLGWDAVELVGVQRCQPHGAPHCAGLIFSMRAGDTVGDVRRSGCIIACGNVRHIWKRAPIVAAICLPWDLAPPVVWET